jgi:dolichol-phosphate mannosyltransferase
MAVSNPVLPLFTEIRTFEEQLAKLGLQTEVIFVDDGSTDDSLTELLKIKVMRPATKIVRLSRNFGAVAVSKPGLKFVTGDCFVIVAADQQGPGRPA